MKITPAIATPTHRCGFASGADAKTPEQTTAETETLHWWLYQAVSSCAWACPVEIMQVNKSARYCAASFAIIGFPHGYMRALW